MRRGKEIAQGSHSSLSFLTRKLVHFPNLHSMNTYTVDFTDDEINWLNNSFAKVCLQVESEQELLDIYTKAKDAGLVVHLITDSGRTEFNGVPTKTCLAIGPHAVEKIDVITGHLKLY